MRRPERLLRLMLVLAAVAAAPAWAQQQQPASKQTFCCTDDNNQQVCSDQLPQICFKRAYRIMEGTTVVKRVEAPLSAEERRRREREERAALEQDRAAKEERRRNRILLDTYNTVQDIDVQRAKAITEIEQGLHQAQQELADLQKKRQALNEETEFYKRRSLPYELEAAIRSNDADIAAQQTIIDAKKKDIAAVHKRFEEDRTRYINLMRNMPKNPEQ